MEKKKNWLTLVLMITSIVLLIGLQVVWLRSLYKDTKRDLRREISYIFSSTVMAMQDSILDKSIKPLPGDSSVEIFRDNRRDSIPFRKRRRVEIQKRHNHNQVIFFKTERPDSVKRFLRPLVMKARSGNRHDKAFSLMITLDSLKPEAIEKKYHTALTKAGISLSFKIDQIDERHEPRETRAIVTEPYPFLPHGPHYVAQFPEVVLFIWKKLFPQLLFSIFLTSLTMAAFYVMYRSIRSNQRLVEIKNDFISNMTHELKTPIATVSVALESLKNFNALENPQRSREYIEMAQQELNRLSILTDKVLKTAIFERNGLTFELESVDVEKITSHVLDSMKLVFEKHKAAVKLFKDGEGFFVNGNTDHLTNVIYNLLDNALKYSNGAPSIEITLKSLDNSIVLSLSDNGIGIAEEHHKRIFEKFFRVPTGDVVNTKGYGLGLNYVKKVIQIHQGEIIVESKLNHGTTFVITLPKLL